MLLRIKRAVSYPSRTVSFELPVPTHLCGGRETQRGALVKSLLAGVIGIIILWTIAEKILMALF